jgi:hypothetical protein
MRCARCGNDNPVDNRFCGMCGATLLATPAVPETQTQRAASAGPAIPAIDLPVAARPQPVEAPRPATRVSEDSPIISGPSFLGLNDPPPRKRASLSIDPRSASGSKNLDYLLDDEDEPKRGGAGKFILILLALALAAGFGYLRWKNKDFGWLNSSPSKPSPAAQNPADGDTNSQAPAASPSTAPESQTPAAAAPAVTPAATPAQPPADSAANGSAATPAAATPPPSTAPPKTDSASSASKPNPPADADDESTADDKEPAASAPAPKPEKAAKPNAGRPDVSPRPRVPVQPARAADSVSEAQKFLYGKGAPQDCDRGLRILKPAANQANPKAMIEMGALYSAGLCTPRDLPTAYRWFALALRKDPDNQAVQTDLQKLWGEMTQPERQLAIKLTQ